MKKSFASILTVVFTAALCFGIALCQTGCFNDPPTGSSTSSADNSASQTDESSCLSHTHNFKQIAENEFLKTEATCIKRAEYYLSCSCGVKSNQTFEYGEYGAHMEEVDKAVAPTCVASGLTEGKHCSVCHKELIAQTEIPALDHDYIGGICSRCNDIESTDPQHFIFTLLNDGTYSISANKNSTLPLPNAIKIPDFYNNKSVTRIDDNAFENCNNVIDILIPESIISIGEKAFSGCNKKLFNITNELIYVEDWVIGVANKDLDNIVFRSNTRGIAYAAFEGCEKITSVDIKNGIISVGTYAFWGCNSLRKITIGSTVTNIEAPIFVGYYQGILDEINVDPDNIKYSGINNCLIDKDEKKIILGCKNSLIPTDESVESIAPWAFAFSDLQSLAIPDNVTTIRFGAFRDCVELSNIEIGDNVKKIEYLSFYCCSNLVSIRIGRGVSVIEEDALSGCEKLLCIIFNGTKAEWRAINKIVGWNDYTPDYIVYCTDGTLDKYDNEVA